MVDGRVKTTIWKFKLPWGALEGSIAPMYSLRLFFLLPFVGHLQMISLLRYYYPPSSTLVITLPVHYLPCFSDTWLATISFRPVKIFLFPEAVLFTSSNTMPEIDVFSLACYI